MGENTVRALKDVNFEVREGDFVAILGPSGSGKSTLMNILGCMDTCTSGAYEFFGYPIHDMKDRLLTKIRNRQIGFIFQKYNLIPKYTVLQNIILPLLTRGYSHSQAAKESIDIIKMLGLSDRLQHRPNELSGGQQQRVAIGRALVTRPSLLLADEPTGALDQQSGQEVLELFEDLNRHGKTIVMITHDPTVAAHAGRTVRIVDGELSE